jgi:hypothetical protein
MSKVGVPVTEYNRDSELRVLWHSILSNRSLLSKLESNTWQGWKLQEILWSGKINEKERKTIIKLTNLTKE